MNSPTAGPCTRIPSLELKTFPRPLTCPGHSPSPGECDVRSQRQVTRPPSWSACFCLGLGGRRSRSGLSPSPHASRSPFPVSVRLPVSHARSAGLSFPAPPLALHSVRVRVPGSPGPRRVRVCLHPLGEAETKGGGGAHRLGLRRFALYFELATSAAAGWHRGARAGPTTARGARGAAGPGGSSGARAAWAAGWRAPRGGEQACACVQASGEAGPECNRSYKGGESARGREGGAAAAPGASPPPAPGRGPRSQPRARTPE